MEGPDMRRLRGLYVEDDELTARLVQRSFRGSAFVQVAANRGMYMSLIQSPAFDFVILDGEVQGWPLLDYAREVSETTELPLFIFSASPAKNLLPLRALKPKAFVRKTDGVQVLVDAVLSYFYALETFTLASNVPTVSQLS